MPRENSRSFLLKCAANNRGAICMLSLLLGGCVTPSVIDATSVGSPKSVAIVDIPKTKNMALIGILVPSAPGFAQFHFSERADEFFEVAGSGSSAPVSGGGSQYGLVGAIISGNAADTQKKATQEFSGEVTKRFPDFDLRADFMKSLRAALEARGMGVTVLEDARNSAPRLRWPAADKEGNKYPSGTLDSAPPVDVDILMQVSPIAVYNSPGPLNAYKRNVTVGIALYNGRTKQFLGRQTVRFSAPDSKFEYHQYASLVEALPEAAPALRDALLSLVPRVADIASGRPSK